MWLRMSRRSEIVLLVLNIKLTCTTRFFSHECFLPYYRLGFGVKPHGLEYGESYGTVAGRMVSWSEIGTITAIAWQRTNHLGPFSGPSD